MDKDKEKEELAPVILSGTTPVHVKFIGWLVLVCAGGFGGWIWWAASMSTKLDMVLKNQDTQLIATKAVVEDVSRLKEWRVQIDSVGTPALSKRFNDLQEQVVELKNKLELHIATTTPGVHPTAKP